MIKKEENKEGYKRITRARVHLDGLRVPPGFAWSNADGRWRRACAYWGGGHAVWPAFNRKPWCNMSAAERYDAIDRIRVRSA